MKYQKHVRRCATTKISPEVLAIAITRINHCRPVDAATSWSSMLNLDIFSKRSSRKARRIRNDRSERWVADKLPSALIVKRLRMSIEIREMSKKNHVRK
eukprot:Skav227148  [mRNA]  locus=scaffold133:631873:639229:- [translate_table: standard]